jgi:AcrR family transcriptional regulator
MCTGVNIEPMAASGRPKRGYHHGDLRNALIKAAAELAEQGGPLAVTVRAAAKAAGVTPTAAYRHFENHEQLLQAAKDYALDGLADTMQARIDALPPIDDPVRHAMATLCAIGRGYIRFATSEPGLFRTAFEQGGSMVEGNALSKVDAAFQLLVKGLDKLVEVGHLNAADRPLAELTPWASVHGFSTLLVDGPVRDLPDEMREAAIERMLTILMRGLSSKNVDDQLVADVLADTRVP